MYSIPIIVLTIQGTVYNSTGNRFPVSDEKDPAPRHKVENATCLKSNRIFISRRTCYSNSSIDSKKSNMLYLGVFTLSLVSFLHAS